jgi:hypothetical protein
MIVDANDAHVCRDPESSLTQSTHGAYRHLAQSAKTAVGGLAAPQQFGHAARPAG